MTASSVSPAPAAPVQNATSTRGLGWLRRLAPHVGTFKRRLALAVVLSALSQVPYGLLPLVQKVIVDDVVLTGERSLWPWLCLLLGLGVSGACLQYVRRYLGAKVSLDLQHALRVAIFRHLHRLDSARHAQLSPGDVMSRAAGDVTLIQMFLHQLPLLAANTTFLAIALGAMCLLSPWLSLVILAFVPLFIVLAGRFRDRIFPASWNDQRLTGDVAGVIEEAVSGVQVVKAFGQEERELSLLIERARELFRSRLRTARLTARAAATLQALPGLAQLGVLIVGGLLVIGDRMTLGVFLAFSSYLLQLVAPVRLLSGMLASSQQARAGAERVLELLELEPSVRDRPEARAHALREASIELEGVTFAHAAAHPTLRGVSLSIRPGERLGIVGASGSGKTTLALLMARFYDPSSGQVRIDGRDAREYTLESLRHEVGIVFEDSFLFSSSIRENIAFARPEATDSEVEAAAHAACAHDFIVRLPQGYATRLGERGATLSGGQRQRIALARAILANPKVLILDDATSAIDALTEESIHRSLEQLMRERTTVIIAHRQSTLRLASRVVVLDAGSVVAEGTHEALLASSELYRRLLSGPELESEGARVESDAGVDRAAWPQHAERDGAARRASVGSELSLAALRSAGANLGAAGHRDLGGGRAAFVAETPELLKRIAELPPLQGEPDVDVGELTRPSTSFSLRAFARRFRGALVLGLCLVVADALANLAAPAVIGRGIDQAVRSHSVLQLALAAALLFGVQLASWINASAMQFQTARTAERLLFALRVRTFAHLQWISLDYYDRELSGRIMTRMTTDVEAFAQLLQQGLLTAVVSLLTCAGVFGMLFTLDSELSLAAFLVLPLLVVGTSVFRRLSAKAYLVARERISAVNANMQESLAGIRVTQAWSHEQASLEHFSALSAGHRDARLRSMQLLAVYFPFLQFLSALAKSIALALGAAQIARGQISAGILLACLLYIDQFFTPLQQLSQVFDQWILARVSLSRIRELLATDTRTPEQASPKDPGRIAGELRFDSVRFAYAKRAPEALRGVDVAVKPGEIVALVGTTGAGKSTFVKLAARFYDATAGVVCVDGVPIRELSLRAFRRQLGYVPQEPFLFSGTVLSNIAYGKPDASDAEVERAARAVGAHEFVASLPLGYLTPVSANGLSLSAGQRQLLCLARAQLVDPAILILDEATSNLDLYTEAMVQRAMRRVARGRTTLIIAHRLQTARVADRIVVVEDGLVVEQGSHDHLTTAGGRYAELWQAFRQSERGATAVRATA